MEGYVKKRLDRKEREGEGYIYKGKGKVEGYVKKRQDRKEREGKGYIYKGKGKG